MTILPGSPVLAATRAAQFRLMDNTAVVQENLAPRTGSGGTKDVWQDTPLSYPCNVQTRNANEVQQAGRTIAAYTYLVKLPWNAAVTERNRLRVEDSFYYIHGTNGDDLNRQTLECYCTVTR